MSGFAEVQIPTPELSAFFDVSDGRWRHARKGNCMSKRKRA
jgi:hypothetical protein